MPYSLPVPSTGSTKVVTASLRAFFESIPKVELHCHLLGSVRKETFLSLAKKNNAAISEHEIEEFYTRGEYPIGAIRVLRALDKYIIQEPDDLYRITYEYLGDSSKNNIFYTEFFWNPTGTYEISGISYDTAQDAIIRGIDDAFRDFGIIGRLIPSIDREATPEKAVQMVEWMKQNRSDSVIGLGMDYRENDRPPELFRDAYKNARDAGFYTTAHASEFGLTWKNVETVVDVLKCNRIDHGYSIVNNSELVQRCRDLNILFTVVPTNSYFLRTLAPNKWAEQHPIRTMAKYGLKIHPNTDDPSIHQVSATDSWQIMYTHLGFSIDDIREFMLNGIEHSWLDNSIKSLWKKESASVFDALREELYNSKAGEVR